jgi:mRNA-degrading endonuclease YafQ of YafQ-DinJ toxin-antitoxin module
LRNIDWTAKSQRTFKRLIRKSPQLRPLIEKTLRQLAEDPYHPSLRTHKLVDDLSVGCQLVNLEKYELDSKLGSTSCRN